MYKWDQNTFEHTGLLNRGRDRMYNELTCVKKYILAEQCNLFEWSSPEGASGMGNFFQKMLILAFEVIVKPCINTRGIILIIPKFPMQHQ